MDQTPPRTAQITRWTDRWKTEYEGEKRKIKSDRVGKQNEL